MVYIDLNVSFLSENLSELFILPSFEWCFMIRCSNCQTVHSKEIYFEETSESSIKNSKGTANFVFKCKECGKESSINVYEKSPRKIDCSQGKGRGVLATFDCRGCELMKWIICNEGIFARGLETNKVFENVDLSDVWMDFDEKNKENCMIEEFKHEFIRNKNL